MALTVPDVSDLEMFKDERFDATEYERVQMFLDMATALVELELGLTVSPSLDTAEGKLVQWAILDLTWYLGTSMDDRDAMFSPFSSERIGSYSYSKAGAAMSSRSATTGVPFLDRLIALLGRRESGGGIGFASYSVMPETLAAHRENSFPDPSETYVPGASSL